VEDMSCMFYGAGSFKSNIGSWNTFSVTTTWSMFSAATSFDQDLSNLDV
jgi:surface protein